MAIFLHSCTATLRGLLLPVLGTLLLCAVILQTLPHDAALGPDRSSGYWLHLPGMLLCGAALATALEHWPLFSRGRPGFAWLLRCQNHRLNGCGVAGLGGLVGLAVALAATGVGFAVLLEGTDHDPGPVRAPVQFDGTASPWILSTRQDTLRFRAGADDPIQTLRLRPTAYAGASERAAQIQVWADGRPLHDGWLENLGEVIELPVQPPRAIAGLELRRRPAPGLVLVLEQIEGEPVATRSSLLNGLFAGLSYLLPAALAFAVLVLGHAHLALPVNLAAGICTVLLCTVTELTPNGAAITAFARGRFVLADADGSGLLPPLAIILALLLAAALLGIGSRRAQPVRRPA